MTPDLRTQLRRVADATDPAQTPIDVDDLLASRRPGRVGRIGPIGLRVAAGVLVVGLLGAAVVAVTGDRGDDGDRQRVGSTVAPNASESANADLLAPGAIRALPPAPLEARFGAATVWTGTEVFVWGGDDERVGRTFADGATFDVRRGEWTPLPPAPLDRRGDASAVWTGTEVLVWGGFASKGIEDDEDPERSDGAAYDPATRTWRRIADAPFAADGFTRAVWTGQDMIVIGARDTVAAAYDPVVDEWRRIAEPPMPLSQSHPQALWTGDRVVARLGSTTEYDVAGIYAYDPGADAWEEYGQPAGSVRADRLVWAGDRLLQIPIDVDRRPEERDPVTGRWEVVGDAPPPVVATTLTSPVAVWTGERALVWGTGFVAAFDPGRGTWTTSGSDRQPTDAPAGVSVVWADGVLFVWGGFPAQATGLLIRPPDPEGASRPGRWTECTTDAPTPAPVRGDGPVVEGGRFGGAMADRRTYDVTVTADGYELRIDGVPAAPPSVVGTATETGWTGTGDRLGVAVGVRPPGAVRTSVIDDQGVGHCAGVSYSADGRWFAIPDVERNWLLVHEDAAGDDVIDPLVGTGPCTVDGDCPPP